MNIAFIGLHCLLDPGSGAAISVRTLLERLSELGHKCFSFTGSCFDNPFAATPELCIRAQGVIPEETYVGQHLIWTLQANGVSHHIFELPSMRREECPEEAQLSLVAPICDFVSNNKIDAVISYGGGPASDQASRILSQRGVRTIFYLVNGSYFSADTFKYFDLIVTDTHATQELYRDRLNLTVHPIGKFINPPPVNSKYAREYVTFVNPIPHKGVTLFYRIAELAAQTMPEAKFLVVESRSSLRAFEEATNLPFSRLPNVWRTPLQVDMSRALSKTRILLMPSVWHESGSRLTLEACAHGVPVICSDCGGSNELLGDAALFLSPPEPLRENHMLLPPLSDAIPWVESLRMLIENQEDYDHWSALARSRWLNYDQAQGLLRFVDLVQSSGGGLAR